MNIRVACGLTAAALSSLLGTQAYAEDAVTAEETPITRDWVKKIEDEELAKLRDAYGDRFAQMRFADARELFDKVALSTDFVEFLTLPGYDRLP